MRRPSPTASPPSNGVRAAEASVRNIREGGGSVIEHAQSNAGSPETGHEVNISLHWPIYDHGRTHQLSNSESSPCYEDTPDNQYCQCTEISPTATSSAIATALTNRTRQCLGIWRGEKRTKFYCGKGFFLRCAEWIHVFFMLYDSRKPSIATFRYISPRCPEHFNQPLTEMVSGPQFTR